MIIDALMAGALDLGGVDAIWFCLEASDSFTWNTDTVDGERVANALFWLGSPEINYPLTPPVISKIRHYLSTGEQTFSDQEIGSAVDRPHLRSVNRMDRDLDA